MRHSLEMRFSIDHPTAAGHFPGNPIIPGAVLLDEVLRALTAGAADHYAIRAVKFLQPVRPGDAVLIQWDIRPDGETTFECRLLEPNRLALTGTARWGAVP